MPAARDDQTRGAFIALRLTGDTIEHAAEQTGISRSTAKRWWKEYQHPELKEVQAEVQPVGPQNNSVVVTTSQTIVPTRERIGGQLLEYVSESLETLRSQAIHGRNPAWLERQRADHLAILYGVIADKAVRVIAAIQNTGE